MGQLALASDSVAICDGYLNIEFRRVGRYWALMYPHMSSLERKYSRKTLISTLDYKSCLE